MFRFYILAILHKFEVASNRRLPRCSWATVYKNLQWIAASCNICIPATHFSFQHVIYTSINCIKLLYTVVGNTPCTCRDLASQVVGRCFFLIDPTLRCRHRTPPGDMETYGTYGNETLETQWRISKYHSNYIQIMESFQNFQVQSNLQSTNGLTDSSWRQNFEEITWTCF